MPIDRADQGDQCRPEQHTPQFRGVEDLGQVGQLRRGQGRREEADKDGDSPKPGNGDGVDVPVADLGECAHAHRNPIARGHGEEGARHRHEKDEKVLAHP